MTLGAVVVYEDLSRVQEVLVEEGFRNTALQIYRRGQVFGLVKPLNEKLEVHVRAYIDGSLDAEVEVSREYLEHLTAGSEPAIELLTGLLGKHGIAYRVVRTPAGGVHAERLRIKRLTPWKPLAAVLALLLLMIKLKNSGAEDATG
ncbi:MAG: hypothetical protein GXN98_02510 [Euryarchaeota archaeon]|nr:hypothetical protein [Euryarchaeota archaeon]